MPTNIETRDDTAPKRVNDLAVGDELRFYGKRFLRYSVVRKVARDGIYEVKIRAVTSGGATETVRIREGSTVQVFQKTYRHERAQYYASLVAIALDGTPATHSEIVARIRSAGGRINGAFIEATLELLKGQERAIATISPKGNTLWRAPFYPQINIPVVAYEGSRTEQLGWIEAWQIARSGQTVALCRWIGGTTGLVAERQLAMATGHRLKVIDAAIARNNGIQPPVYIPSDLMIGLIVRYRPMVRGRRPPVLDQQKMGAIAKLLDVPACGSRNQIMTYLDIHYPEWKTYAVQQAKAS